jgi:3-hydroxyisobutyrate dehydrogenase-like beta-hydroxyacid dehydrogenase
MAKQKLGFIGVGNMGGPMSGHLLKKGHELVVYDTSEAAVARVVAQGAKRLSSVKQMADEVESVLLCLPTPAIVESVALGAGGLLEGSKLKTVVDLSTIGPRTAIAVAAGLARRNISYVDSPVSGGVPGAVKATLAVMVSCPRPMFEALEPVLKTFGKTFYLGDKPGQAQTMKLANNIMSATAVAITSEAVVMGVKAGLDPKVMIDVINSGSGRNTASEDKFPRCVLPRTFDVGFKAALAYKDVRLCVDEAEQLGAPMVVGSAVREMLAITLATIGKEADYSEVVKVCEAWAGVEVRGRSSN